ncbi:sensor domain-containing diguanylate cyclase [Marinomonas epiphytica]
MSLAVTAVLLTVGNGFYSTYRLQKELLINTALESNRVYAEKLAIITGEYFAGLRESLAIGAELVQPFIGGDTLQSELDGLKSLTKGFNSLSIITKTGVISSISPESVGLQGSRIDSSYEFLFSSGQEKVFGPVIGPSGLKLVMMSQPIFDENGEHLANLVGTIYLHKSDFLKALLSDHSFIDGSYVYVVSPLRELIFHPQPKRIGEVVTVNEVIDRAIAGQHGAREVVNSRGVAMVTGYAFVKSLGWGVVAQSPREAVLKKLDRQLWTVVDGIIPIQILILFAVVICSYFIALPLRQLADSTNFYNKNINIRAWFYEAFLIKKAFQKEIDILSERVVLLDEDRKTDPLTHLKNRRGMDELVNALIQKQTPFCILFFDVDHFKKINDQFGHDVGDDVLIEIANVVSEKLGVDGEIIRSGGEEFTVVLANKTTRFAMLIAEDIRLLVASWKFKGVNRPVTISIGISNWHKHLHLSDAFKLADIAMYESKRNGRNQVTSHFNEFK